MRTFEIIATCPQELREVVGKELKEVGARNIRNEYKAVAAQLDEKAFYLAHLHVATASQIFMVIGKGSAKTKNMLFSQASRVKWDQYINLKKTYRIDGIAGDRENEALPSSLISKKTREGLQDYFAYHNQQPPKVDVKNPDIIFTSMIRNGRVVFAVCTSGKPLHKRGYRSTEHPAPLKETLARAVLRLCSYEGQEPFFDPMAGSGTLAIEAAFIALNKSPLIHRKKGEFGFEHLNLFNRSLWKEIQQNCREDKKNELSNPIFVNDIDQTFVTDSKSNALRARVERHLNFNTNSFFKCSAPSKTPGVLVTNIPYDVRLSTRNTEGSEEAKVFYKNIGDHLKKNFKGWKAHILVNEDSPYKFIGLKPSKKTPLLNGGIKTKLLTFELY